MRKLSVYTFTLAAFFCIVSSFQNYSFLNWNIWDIVVILALCLSSYACLMTGSNMRWNFQEACLIILTILVIVYVDVFAIPWEIGSLGLLLLGVVTPSVWAGVMLASSVAFSLSRRSGGDTISRSGIDAAERDRS
ncbi:MAG: hypothetical protein IT307_12265 [Chloroflexi bacterium]|nr:hypothetical protein [Chloroflexota bacterium]